MVSKNTMTMCQFLIGKVQQMELLEREITATIKCQFLIGKVQLIMEIFGIFQKWKSCQFLIGTVQQEYLRCS